MKKITSLLSLALSMAFLSASAAVSARGPSSPTVVTPTLAEFHDRITAIGLQATPPVTPPVIQGAGVMTVQNGKPAFAAVALVHVGTITHFLNPKWNLSLDVYSFGGVSFQVGEKAVPAVGILGGKSFKLADQVNAFLGIGAEYTTGGSGIDIRPVIGGAISIKF